MSLFDNYIKTIGLFRLCHFILSESMDMEGLFDISDITEQGDGLDYMIRQYSRQPASELPPGLSMNDLRSWEEVGESESGGALVESGERRVRTDTPLRVAQQARENEARHAIFVNRNGVNRPLPRSDGNFMPAFDQRKFEGKEMRQMQRNLTAEEVQFINWGNTTRGGPNRSVNELSLSLNSLQERPRSAPYNLNWGNVVTEGLEPAPAKTDVAANRTPAQQPIPKNIPRDAGFRSNDPVQKGFKGKEVPRALSVSQLGSSASATSSGDLLQMSLSLENSLYEQSLHAMTPSGISFGPVGPDSMDYQPFRSEEQLIAEYKRDQRKKMKTQKQQIEDLFQERMDSQSRHNQDVEAAAQRKGAEKPRSRVNPSSRYFDSIGITSPSNRPGRVSIGGPRRVGTMNPAYTSRASATVTGRTGPGLTMSDLELSEARRLGTIGMGEAVVGAAELGGGLLGAGAMAAMGGPIGVALAAAIFIPIAIDFGYNFYLGAEGDEETRRHAVGYQTNLGSVKPFMDLQEATNNLRAMPVEQAILRDALNDYVARNPDRDILLNEFTDHEQLYNITTERLRALNEQEQFYRQIGEINQADALAEKLGEYRAAHLRMHNTIHDTTRYFGGTTPDERYVAQRVPTHLEWSEYEHQEAGSGMAALAQLIGSALASGQDLDTISEVDRRARAEDVEYQDTVRGMELMSQRPVAFDPVLGDYTHPNKWFEDAYKIPVPTNIGEYGSIFNQMIIPRHRFYNNEAWDNAPHLRMKK